MIRSFYIAAKDLKAEFRTKQMLNSMFIYSLLVLVVFSISFGDFLGDSAKVEKLAPGVLWIAFTFAGMLGLSRTFVMETENGCVITSYSIHYTKLYEAIAFASHRFGIDPDDTVIPLIASLGDLVGVMGIFVALHLLEII